MGWGESGRVGISLLVGEPLDVEGYPQAPSGLELEQVHVYVRHGERTPVRTRMVDPPASIPEYWQMCSVARRFREAVKLTTAKHREPASEGAWFKRGTEMRDGSTATNLCLLGDLTDIGKESTYNFGVALRKLYVDRLGFLPGRLHNEKQAYFRSTNVPRTIESLEHIVHGLYPQKHCASGVIPSILVRYVVGRDGPGMITYLCRNKVDENIVSNILSCPQLGLLELRFAQAAAARWNSRLQTLDERLSKYIKGKPIRVDGSPRASGILDTVRSAAAHGIKVPDDFWDPEVVDLIVCPQFSKFNGIKTEQGRRLGMGRLLADVSTKMQTKIEEGDKDPLNLLVYSTHDSTLAALCSTFDIFDEKWPPFTSSVTFELFKKRHRDSEQGLRLQSLLSGLWNAHSKEEHCKLSTRALQHLFSLFSLMAMSYLDIRMRYKNKNLVLPMCAKEGDHLPGSPEFCTFSVFQRRVKELTPVNWSAECASS
ncbi:phosphoglycerate mutase-like protein [Butyriboletus roseoflavus]|nr:phosphoglycerate mutase-like protein [Butyriboletus roseoflavus]